MVKEMKLKRCDMDTFSERTAEKEIICYGIGGEFRRIIRAYGDFPWVKRIGRLVVSDTNIKGRVITLQDKNLQISGVDELRKEISARNVILVTSLAYAEILEVLKNIPELLDTDVYLFHFMFGMTLKKHNFSIRNTKEAMIPPVIHYCWFGKKELPDTYKRYIDSWKRFCPDYEIVRWDESNCDINETEYTKQSYECGKFGFVPDYFRLKIIYEKGGIYLDTDVELIKPFDEIRYNEAFCGMQYPGEIALGLGFGARKGHQLIKRFMDTYINRPFLGEDGVIDLTTAPVIQTDTLKKAGITLKPYYQNVDGLSIFPVETLSPQNVVTGELLLAEKTISIHHFDGSWIGEKKRWAREKRRNDALAILELLEEEK